MYFMGQLSLKIREFVLEHSNSHGNNIFWFQRTTALNIIKEFIWFGFPIKRSLIWNNRDQVLVYHMVRAFHCCTKKQCISRAYIGLLLILCAHFSAIHLAQGTVCVSWNCQDHTQSTLQLQDSILHVPYQSLFQHRLSISVLDLCGASQSKYLKQNLKPPNKKFKLRDLRAYKLKSILINISNFRSKI